jgi:cell division septal protein FtsQ
MTIELLSMKKQRRKKKSDKFLSGSGKFLIGLVVFYLLYFAVTKIVETEQNKSYIYARNEIEVTGNRIISDTKILNMCGFLKNTKGKIEIDPERIAQDLMSLAYIKGVSIKDRPPRMLSISIEERRPVAFVYGLGLNLIDADGFLMPIPNNDIVWDLPLITGIKPSLGKLGQETSAAPVYRALNLITYLEQENPLLLEFISEISMENENYFEIHLIKGGTKIRINLETFRKELFVLKNYLVNYADWKQLRNIEYIDLRFQNQLVIKYRA